MWNFGGGGGGGNPWLQNLVRGMGAARGGGMGMGGGQPQGGGRPMFGLGGLFSQMGQGWGGGGDRTMQPHGSPNSMSFAPQQFAAQPGMGGAAGPAAGGVKIGPEIGQGQYSRQNDYQWNYGGGMAPPPNTFRPDGAAPRKGGQSTRKDDED